MWRQLPLGGAAGLPGRNVLEPGNLPGTPRVVLGRTGWRGGGLHLVWVWGHRPLKGECKGKAVRKSAGNFPPYSTVGRTSPFFTNKNIQLLQSLHACVPSTTHTEPWTWGVWGRLSLTTTAFQKILCAWHFPMPSALLHFCPWPGPGILTQATWEASYFLKITWASSFK